MAEGCINVLLMRELEEERRRERRRKRRFRKREDAFNLSDDEFTKLFRLSKNLARNLIDSLAEVIPERRRSSSLSVETKVLAALRFYATGSYHSCIAQDLNTAMSRSRVSRVINEVTTAINDHLFDRWVSLDLRHDAVARTRQRFFDKFGFPGVVGVVDCTHISMVAPPQNHPVFKERDYFNHKRYHSVNVQVVCDCDFKITSMNSRFCGSTHDAFIMANSAVKPAMTQAHERYNVWLLGDSGYAVAPWLMTPIPGYIVPHSPEENFNRCLTRARSTVERCIGIFKSRWRCLIKHRVLHYLPDKVSKIANACAVLHNMCVDANLPLNHEDMVEMEDLGIYDDLPQNDPINQRGRAVRQRVIAAHFT